MTEPGSVPRSVNDVLRASVHGLPRVSLREAPDADHTPVHRPAAPPQAVPAGERRWPEHVGPYHIAGEIARGGMGTILKARDIDLGRDVALKVLHGEHQESPDVLRRFIEEAQIASQLQHPGIVAVHGMGLLADGLPYFVMKLVKGRTLAAILDERRDPREERQRLLGSFEQVCQAVAYAHARRVVHRDLKPSNIMIGAFGEVQVMDWGLAKVLPREKAPVQAGTPEPRSIITTIRSGSGSSQSLAGSVLGTPAYMAPEQARGELDRVDARSDVFGLGAILCEILTGKAPYTGTSLEEIYHQARKGYLDEALARLAGCGAAEELVALTRRCLAFEPRERPADASIIAREVKAHLDALEERTRRLAVEEVEARARLREERRGRRLTLLVGAALAVLLAAAGLSWLWVQAARDRQAAEASRLARSGLEEAQRLLGAAQSGQSGVAAPWDAALASAREAVARAGSVPTSSHADDARLHLEKTEAAAAQARAAWEREERKKTLLVGLQAVRHGHSFSGAEVNAGYRRAFRGFGVDAESGPSEEAVRRLRESGAETDIALGLSLWAGMLHDALTERSGGWKRLLELSEAVDPDPLRIRLRRAWLLRRSQDVPELYRLVAEARKQEFSLETVVLLARRVSERGNSERGYRLLQDALSRAPDDLSVHDGMTEYGGDWGDLRLPHRMAKCALAPASAEMLSSVVDYYRIDVDQPAEAAPWAEEAMRLRPADSALVASLGSNTAKLRGARSAQPLFREALRLNPYDSVTWNNYAVTLDDTGDPEASIQGLRASLRIERDGVVLWNLGRSLQPAGDQDGALAAWTEALSRGLRGSDAHESIGTLLYQRGEFAAAEHHLRRQMEGVTRNITIYRLGMCEWAQGRRAEAIGDLGRAFRAFPVAAAANGMGDAIAALSTFKLPPRDDPSFNALAGALRGLAEGLEEAAMEGPVAWQFRGVLLRAREALLEPLAPEAAFAEATRAASRRGARIPELRALEAFARWKNGEKTRGMRILEEVLQTTEGAPHIARRLETLRAEVRPDLLTFASIDAAFEDSVTLVPAGDRWRYFPGTREPSRGNEWTRPEFDDSGWSEGPSGFGYGDADDATELRDMAGKYTSLYLRRRLTVPEASAGRVELRVVSDDGFVAYVNGREAGRFRAGSPGTGLSYFSRATGIHEANPLQPDVLEVSQFLVEGDNVIAIQGLNESPGSSDFTLIPEVLRMAGKDPSRDQQLLDQFRVVAGGEDAGARVAYLEARAAERAGKPVEALAAYERAAAANARDPEPLERVVATLDALGRGGEVRPRLESAFRSGTLASRSLVDRWLAPVDGTAPGLSALLAAWPQKAQPYELVISPRSSPPPAQRWRFSEARPPEGWERTPFDDSAWTEAPAPFGFGDAEQARKRFLVNTPWRSPDLWIRRKVTVDLPPSLPNHLRLSVAARVCHDDHAEVYLNGVGIARFGGWSDNQYREEEYRGALPLLPGENLIAAHCHNLKVGSALDVELVIRIMTVE